jgi:hypothetical protein
MNMQCVRVSLVVTMLIFCVVTFSVSVPVSFAFEKPLKTEKAKVDDITGTFTLILYGGRFADDLETFAILDCEGDQYTFEPYAPDFDYRIKKGIQAKKAIEEAKKFVSFHNSFWRSQLSKIVDSKGNTIGYELRPLYLPFVYGISDVLEIHYWLKKGNKVRVTIRLTPSLERSRFLGGGDGDAGGH